MIVWLLALAHQAEVDGTRLNLPRRLVWVVNRRVVVDQATDEAKRLREKLQDAGIPELGAVRRGLRKLCATQSQAPLGISTLRGQFADNAEWRDDPARPAIIVGTVDMIGSRLLFSGYGCGFKSRPLHAGFVGQDSLIVHDEAHLEPAFQTLLKAVEEEQERCPEMRRLRVMALTATSRDPHAATHGLTSRDLEPGSEISKRVMAGKWLKFHRVESEKAISEEIVRRALEFRDSGQAIVVFVRKVRDVATVAEKLRKERLPVLRLTGTMRGYERDRMAQQDLVFARFLPRPTAALQSGTVYLVCTAAGEVGVDLSADHMVSDLTPFDSMAQRLGRVNRFGNGDARVEVVYAETSVDAKKKPEQLRFDQACQRTLDLLQNLPAREDGRRHGSPAALGGLPPEKRSAAFTPLPVIPSTSRVLFDAWALTSIRDALPGRPPVADWLHGVPEDWEPPQTNVGWRQEVKILQNESLRDRYRPAELLEDYPLKTHELLHDASSRVAENLKLIAARCPEEPVWLVKPDGEVQAATFRQLFPLEGRSIDEADLADGTVLLAPETGGLEGGMLNGGVAYDEARGPYDVSGDWIDEAGVARRRRVWDDESAPEGMRLVQTIDTLPPDSETEDEEVTRRFWRWYVRPRSADDDGSRTAGKEQELDPHNQDAKKLADVLAMKLNLTPMEALAVSFASGWHDLGKRRGVWQRSIGNADYPGKVLAKSGRRMPAVSCSAYRHEFGSLRDLTSLDEFKALPEEAKELVLHLVAAHHGRARPHFPGHEAFDPESSKEQADRVAREVPQRFARLQRKYGRWGLAYLESLVRSADWLASQGIEPAGGEE